MNHPMFTVVSRTAPRVAIVLSVLVLTALPDRLEGQSPADRSVRVIARVPSSVRAEERFDASHSVGVFVGVRHFDDVDFAEVPYAVDDAVDLAYLFAFDLRLIPPRRVFLCLEGRPRKPASQERLEKLEKAGAKRRSAESYEILDLVEELAVKKSRSSGLFVVTLATHGFSDEGNDFLLASDSLRHRMASTGIALGKILDEISRAKTPRRLVLLDACRHRLSPNRNLSDQFAAMKASFAEAIAKSHGQVVLSGTVPGGFAYDDAERGNGVFTAAVLDGLQGQAPADDRGFITIRLLAGYVERQVVGWIERHRPEHVGVSRGISVVLEAVNVADMPLAVAPEHLPEATLPALNVEKPSRIDFSGEWTGIYNRSPYLYVMELTLSRSYDNQETRFEGQVQIGPLVTPYGYRASTPTRGRYEIIAEYDQHGQSLVLRPATWLESTSRTSRRSEMIAVYSSSDDTIAGIHSNWPSTSSPFFIFRRPSRADTLLEPARRSINVALRKPWSELQQLVPGRAPGLSKDRVDRWVSRLTEEYPGFNSSAEVMGQLWVLGRKFFRDSHFSTELGTSFDQMKQAEYRKIQKYLRIRSQRDRDDGTSGMRMAFERYFSGIGVVDATVSTLALRAMEAWHETMRHRLEYLQPGPDADRFLSSFETQIGRMRQAFWPSEVRRIQNRLGQIRRELAKRAVENDNLDHRPD